MFDPHSLELANFPRASNGNLRHERESRSVVRMSFFLAPHDDEHDTLQAALAYLDDWTATGVDCEDIELDSLDEEELDDEATTGSGSDSSQSLYPPSDKSDLSHQTSSSSSSDNGCDAQDAASASTAQLHQRRGPKTRCMQLVRRPSVVRKRDPPPPRRNNKNEILELRDEVILLKARLTQLRSRGPNANNRQRPSAGAVAGSNPAPLLLGASGALNELDDGAQLEFRRLHQSEALNRTLKAALTKQINLGKRLENLFKKQAATIVSLLRIVSYWRALYDDVADNEPCLLTIAARAGLPRRCGERGAAGQYAQ